MLKGLLFIILLVIIIGGIILLIMVNFVLSIIRRLRRGGYDDDDFDTNDNVRRHSNQYHFRGTETSYSNTARGAQREEARQSYSNSNSSEQEIIVDMRDAQVANRQIISDDEGEYVDFVEEK